MRFNLFKLSGHGDDIYYIYIPFHIHIHPLIIALLGIRLSSVWKNLSNKCWIDVNENTIWYFYFFADGHIEDICMKVNYIFLRLFYSLISIFYLASLDCIPNMVDLSILYSDDKVDSPIFSRLRILHFLPRFSIILFLSKIYCQDIDILNFFSIIWHNFEFHCYIVSSQ